ncbi:glycine oxidase ThiO [Chelativorans sp. YIM 93263]|uniref:glycine oxidase ThiO n=1 Tax=Chelativorans sp. YIM 93263 TaxID=2906648 RepID=UPI002378BE94|nr:glycine oxidase ThiO [Chelativorans sp. YIM 93263]
MHVLIRGAGVAGLAVAYELVQRGAAVTVADTASSLGAGASWCAGGMLAPYCERESAEEDVITLGKGAASWWDRVLPGIVNFKGTLVVAPPRNAFELKHFVARTTGYAAVSAEEIAALEPDLDGRFQAGLFFAEEAHLDPRAALEKLQVKLASKGVQFAFGPANETDHTCFDRVVDCTGMAAKTALPQLRGIRGEMLYLETPEITLSRPVRLIHPRFPVYIVPRGNGRFMVGATMIESDDEGPPSARSLVELLNAAYALHPAFAEARILELSSGVRPAFPDNLPRIVERGVTAYVNGLYRHGFLLAPALARQAAEVLYSNEEASFNEADRQRRTA